MILALPTFYVYLSLNQVTGWKGFVGMISEPVHSGIAGLSGDPNDE